MGYCHAFWAALAGGQGRELVGNPTDEVLPRTCYQQEKAEVALPHPAPSDQMVVAGIPSKSSEGRPAKPALPFQVLEKRNVVLCRHRKVQTCAPCVTDWAVAHS